MKNIKDWTASLADIANWDDSATLAIYSEMLATAHDIGYKVPDQQLIETEDAAKLKAVMPALHEGLVAFHAAAKAEAKVKADTAAKKAAKPVKEKKAAKVKAETAPAPTKPAKKVAQKVAPEEKTMAKAAKTAKTPAKKAAPAKKSVAKKGAKKAAAANARMPAAARNPFGEKAVIKVLIKENPARADSERGRRIAVVMKYNGKKVADFFANEKPPFNRTDTLRYLIDNEFITIK